jgi:steroid 5-alpha reductase family enzyme
VGWFVTLFGLAALGQAVAMGGAWQIQRQTCNAGWVDVVWTMATGLGGMVCALAPVPALPGPRQFVVAALAAAWSIRLAAHIAARTFGRPEDVRYARFREEWGASFQRRMFVFLMIQAAAAALLTLSMLAAARNPAPALRLADWVGIAVLATAITGEGLADGQMRRFRAQMRPGAVCDTGLWGWSRHPNYFFEWLGWCAYPVMAINLHWWPGWLALTGPALMFWLLRYVSGVPPLEEAMLRSRGAVFADYQRRVSAFFPLPPRRQERIPL